MAVAVSTSHKVFRVMLHSCNGEVNVISPCGLINNIYLILVTFWFVQSVQYRVNEEEKKETEERSVDHFTLDCMLSFY